MQEQERQDWLKEIAQKSWEPELLVSGAAIYLTSNLPAWINQLDNFYVTNLLLVVGASSSTLPVLAIGFLRLMSYILLFAFIAHFTMRAFWVASVGLLSVFPQDINYANLPSPRYSEYFKTHISKHLGTLKEYVNRLDKTCSSLLSIAFLVAITLFGISFTYFSVFAVIETIGSFVNPENRERYEEVAYLVFSTTFILIATVSAVLNIPALKKKPLFAQWQFKVYLLLNNFFFPFTNKAIQRINFAFISNISRKTYYKSVVVFAVLMVCIMPFTFKSANLFDRLASERTFYSKGTRSLVMDNNFYEDLRNPYNPVLQATISSQVIKGDFLRVFLSYPKRMDKELKKLCPENSFPDSLRREELNEMTDLHSLACLDKFFTISINDSVYPKELMFTKHHANNEVGLVTFLSTKNFKEGKNVLKIVRFHSDSTKTDAPFNTFIIPFWHANN